MNTKEMTRQVRLAHWINVLRERNESGKSIRAWCQENEINQKTYHYWQRKLRETACEQVNELQGTRQTGLVPLGFAQVALREKQDELPELQSTGQIIIEKSGLRIAADSAYPTDTLKLLFRELIRR